VLESVIGIRFGRMSYPRVVRKENWTAAFRKPVLASLCKRLIP
jgi:hypothetical protein